MQKLWRQQKDLCLPGIQVVGGMKLAERKWRYGRKPVLYNTVTVDTYIYTFVKTHIHTTL